MTMRTEVPMFGAFAIILTAIGGCATSTSTSSDTTPSTGPTLRFDTSITSRPVGPGPEAQQAYDTARQFATTWVNRGLVESAWRTRLAELSTPELGSRINAGTLPRPQASVLPSSDFAATRQGDISQIGFGFTVEDGYTHLVMFSIGSSWRVNDVQITRLPRTAPSKGIVCVTPLGVCSPQPSPS